MGKAVTMGCKQGVICALSSSTGSVVAHPRSLNAEQPSTDTLHPPTARVAQLARAWDFYDIISRHPNVEGSSPSSGGVLFLRVYRQQRMTSTVIS